MSSRHFSHELSKYRVHDQNILDPPGSYFIYYSTMVFYLILQKFETNLMQSQDCSDHFSKYTFIFRLTIFHALLVYSFSMTALQLFEIIAESSIILKLTVKKIVEMSSYL
jgi:hypothetical protein